jgi:hypothetical protein
MPETFVLMEKDGERIEVHPLVVSAHEAIGWKQVVAAPVAVETEAPLPSATRAADAADDGSKPSRPAPAPDVPFDFAQGESKKGRKK